MGQYLGLWEWLKGMESPWCDGITWVAWKASDRRSLDDLESLEGRGRFGFGDCQSWAHNHECVYNKQQIVSLGVTLSGAEVDLLLRISNIE